MDFIDGEDLASIISKSGAVSEAQMLEFKYDVEQAKALPDQIYPERSDIPDIDIAYYTTTGGKGLSASELERQWEDSLGVNLNHVVFNNSTDFYDRLNSDPPHMYRMATCGQFNDAHAYFTRMLARKDTAADSDWEYVLNMVKDAEVIIDQDERKQLYTQAEEILVKTKALILPLRWSKQLILTHPDIHPVESNLMRVERFEKWSVIDE